MHGNANTTDSLRRVFYEGFVAQDIAEPLASFDVTADTETVRSFMVDRPLTVVGIRDNGIVSGYIEQAHVDDRPLIEQVCSTDSATIVSASAPLHAVVTGLKSASFLLVSSLGQPIGVIVREDFEKPPMRMWLFGMITLFELSLTRIVDDHYPDESWTPFVSSARLEKAIQLQSERGRRKRSVRLLDCLQLGDKGQLLSRSEVLRQKFWNRSRRQIEIALKETEALRNNLAHSQPLVSENWDVIIRISSTLDRILEIPAELIAPSSLNPYNPRPQSALDEGPQ